MMLDLQLDAEHQIVAALGHATHVSVAFVQHGIAAHQAQPLEAVAREH